MSLPQIAWKVLTGPQWTAWQENGIFLGAPVDLADGYIHMSAAEQVTETVEKHFAGQEGLVVVRVDLGALGEAIRWEPSRGGALFPHAYAPMPIGVAIAHAPLSRDADGKVVLP
ncbi:hypothetical protein Y88_0649 [Novosphingobium nitrogenifigens DSM 19370]|uniref:DUF952 domain-containing protein n=1 Tax=Novosphingobium nitrogenifigens DSM 19370 TaxID=983920 RepID=F1ZA00_9SPHN|nr:DUF952 domain-containing protein [Novosphingobium nitrogenifigens]EGD58592.1 hypothetical protein Y88_0649 [Novosphingobium nitrogenifigens DSM 19370]